ncbi:hypothetical protein AA0475_0129 [Acetobacter peroxydans]|nr:hypothetical protein AA13755_1014 [Acetobacter peroxydans NBRC 13755]GBR39304.1 hypothetical protein AA0475_0129 [Acetobacter peroxydans]
MTNGSNDFGVEWHQICWIERWLGRHINVLDFTRVNDIQFDVIRKRGCDIHLICLDEYTCTLSRVLEVLDAFPVANFLYIGGNWNSYERAAKEYCLENKIGLFNTNEISGAFHRNDFWTYHRKAQDGNPIYG